jgi:hypothetical protein
MSNEGSLQIHQQADIISVLSGKSHGSLNKYAKIARAKKRAGYSAGKHTDVKAMFKDGNHRSPVNSQKDGKYGGLSTFLGKTPQNFNYYASDFHGEMLGSGHDSQHQYIMNPSRINSDP